MNVCYFKQKTAYELRISDGSSDVCSSDLFVALSAQPAGMSRYFLPLALVAAPLSAQDHPADNVSEARLRADIDTLVGFGTRHTLSEQDNPQRGDRKSTRLNSSH